MRIRFEIQSLRALGVGAHQLPVNCWRLTILYQQPVGPARSVTIDGVKLLDDLATGDNNDLSHLARIVVGGVFTPSGEPVNLDQVLRVTVPTGNLATGMLVYEYLEP